MHYFRTSTNRPLHIFITSAASMLLSSWIWGKVWSWYSLKGVCIIEKTLNQLHNEEQSGWFTDSSDQGGVHSDRFEPPEQEVFDKFISVCNYFDKVFICVWVAKLFFLVSIIFGTAWLFQKLQRSYTVMQVAGVFLCSLHLIWFIILLIKAFNTKSETNNSRGLCSRKTWIMNHTDRIPTTTPHLPLLYW